VPGQSYLGLANLNSRQVYAAKLNTNDAIWGFTATTSCLQFGDISVIRYLFIQISYIYDPFHFQVKIGKMTILTKNNNFRNEPETGAQI